MVLPFLALMFAVALDYCRIFYMTQTVQNAAWVGAMYASGTSTNPGATSPTEAAKQAAVAEASSLSPALDPNNVPAGSLELTMTGSFKTAKSKVSGVGTINISLGNNYPSVPDVTLVE
jgi:hypothetical protein